MSGREGLFGRLGLEGRLGASRPGPVGRPVGAPPLPRSPSPRSANDALAMSGGVSKTPSRATSGNVRFCVDGRDWRDERPDTV